jgi:hypothetical protein
LIKTIAFLEEIIMSKTLKIGNAVLPVHNIRSIRPLNDEERTRIAERYGRSSEEVAAKQISITFADKSTRTAELTLDDVRAQGVALVNAGADRYVPAANIRSAEPFTKADADKLKEGSDYTLTQTFRSRVETTAGTVLSSATPQQIIERAAKVLETAGRPARAAKAPTNG